MAGTVRHEVVNAAPLLEPPEDPLEAAVREGLTPTREEERAIAGLSEIAYVPIDQTRGNGIQTDNPRPPLPLACHAANDDYLHRRGFHALSATERAPCPRLRAQASKADPTA
jgi:hypothetical protein